MHSWSPMSIAARDDHQLGAATRQLQLRLHLRDRPSFGEPFLGQIAAFRLAQHVDVVHRLAQHLVALMPRHLQEALVDLDEAQVAQSQITAGAGLALNDCSKRSSAS